MGENEQQWEEAARLVQEAGADMIECNFSCPQMTSHAMGSDVGQSPELVEKYCRAVKRGSTLPMLAKMTPNIGDMCEVALAAKRGGMNGDAAINTVKSITNIDLNQKIGMPIVNAKIEVVPGCSGKTVKPIALRFIHKCAPIQNCAISQSAVSAALKPGRMRLSFYCSAQQRCR